VIETATPACSIALLDAGSLVAERHEVVGRGHAERLVPAISELLDQVGARPGAILVDCGPGSFTGVRVGLAAARALGFAWRAPVQGCSSLALIAAAVLAETGDAGCAIALAGGHGELFVQRFAGGPLRALDDLASLAPDAAADAVPELLVIGSGAAALVAARGFGTAHDHVPRASDARHLPAAFSALPPRPIYGRAPDARLPA
jgi:tRNA threonylcarbamoyladenosine biosynthesis protein TsaB